ncbi:hypothetical protein Q4493_00380 [Colwellia sp. 1_MG-2023]|uniref:hypothetical protein n=1 Tax=Colwellia sp. 1_MG-2023 TaxID=3062649 RepID=UPI0026E2592D|nr:hypothetical protein [Colwellia sp. 1_MG-2023]MDO6444220.1 hypothetical protein [Colwellia sp. 1_MG-2023]
MPKIVMIFVVFICSFQLSAEEVAELPPLDPSYVGEHGMVLFTKSSSIYASHLPLYHKPHNVQLIYKLENKNLALLQSVRDGGLVTIKPKPFNLQRLMRGEKMIINVDVYSGHFERDGMLVYENIPLSFAKRLYVREMIELEESSRQQAYDVINLNKNYKIYVHKIQKAPSFDHILYIDVEASCLGRFNTSSAVPKENELLYKFVNCGTMTPLYYETQDFREDKI